MSGGRATLALMLAVSLGAGELMAEEPSPEEKTETMDTPRLFYRGDLDDQVITVDNGVRVNSAYASFVADGPWAEVKTWEVTPRIHTITGYGIANHTFVEGETGLIMIDTGQNLGAGLEALKMKQLSATNPSLPSSIAIITTLGEPEQSLRVTRISTYPSSDTLMSMRT